MSTLLERFRAKIFKSGECWLFTGYCNQDGHGRIKVNGKLRQASHVAWFLKYGVWPTLQLNHTCDQPACVKIGHLYEGTQKQNIADMRARGRSPPCARLVRWEGIDYTIDELAAKAGVTRTAMLYRIEHGQDVFKTKGSHS